MNPDGHFLGSIPGISLVVQSILGEEPVPSPFISHAFPDIKRSKMEL